MNTESEKEHRATLISREYLDVTGIEKVESFTKNKELKIPTLINIILKKILY